MCLEYGVSRTVVRQALDEMEREGLVYKIKGKGAFVTGRKFDSTFVQHAAGFHASMTSRGHVVTSDVLVQEVRPAGPHAARMLGLDVGVPVLALDRVRSVDGVRIQVVRAWLPYRLCRGLERVDLGDASVYAVLADRYGLRPHHGWRTIEAVAIPAQDAALLGVEPSSPGLLDLSRRSLEVRHRGPRAIIRGREVAAVGVVTRAGMDGERSGRRAAR